MAPAANFSSMKNGYAASLLLRLLLVPPDFRRRLAKNAIILSVTGT
jgi:hypothetical protein